DHIFPRRWFTPPRLRAASVPDSTMEEFRERMNGLPNMQILEGPVNSQKADLMPMEWARRNYSDEQARSMYLAAHDMPDLPETISQFLNFYEARRDRICDRLRTLLGIAGDGDRTAGQSEDGVRA